MATFTMQCSTYISCKVDYWEERISPQTSRIHAEARIARTNSWSGITSDSSFNAYITIHGQEFHIYSGYYQLYASDGWKWIGSAVKDISHGDAITVGVSYRSTGYGSYLTSSGSGSLSCAAFYSAPTSVSGTMLTQDAPQRGRAYSRVNVGGWGNNSAKSYWIISKSNNRNPVSEWAASTSSNTMYWSGLPSNKVVTWYAEAYNNHGYATFAGPYKLSALSTPSASATGGTSAPSATLSSSITYRGGTAGSTTEDNSEIRSWRLYYKRADQAWSATESPQQIKSGTSLDKSVTFNAIPRTTFEPGYNYHVSMTPVNSYGAWGDTSNLSGGVRILRCPQNVRASNIDTEVPEEAAFTMTAGQAGGFAGESESAGYTNGAMWGYQIEYSKNSDLSNSQTSALTKGNRINLTGLSLNTTYYYRIRGYNSYGLSNLSSIGSFKTREEFNPQGVSITQLGSHGSFRYKNLSFTLGTQILHAGGLSIDAESIASVKLQAKPWEGFYDQNGDWVAPYWGTIAEDTSGNKNTTFNYTMSDVLSSFGYAYNRPNPRINGSTTQQTYSGKNLVNIFGTPTWTGADTTYIAEGKELTVEGAWHIGFKVNVKTNTRYYVSAERKDSSGTGTVGGIRVYSGDRTTRLVNLGTTNGYFDSGSNTSVNVLFYASNGESGKVTFYEPQVEEGSQKSSYEPYVGGTPAPNPDYPQEIQNTTIGTLELCQIGNYQDYAYYSEGKWYKHAEVIKFVLDGTSATNGYYTEGNWFYTRFEGLNIINVGGVAPTPGKNTHFTPNAYRYMQDNLDIPGTTQSSTNLIVRNPALSTIAEYGAWLAAQKPVFYYPLATATDTEITDQETLDELNRWLEEGWLTYFSGIDFRIVYTNTRGRELIINGSMTPPTNVRASGYKRYQNRPLQFTTNASAEYAGQFSFTTDLNTITVLPAYPMSWLFAANVDAPSTVGTVYSSQLSVTGLLSKISTGKPGDSIDYNSTYNGVVALTSSFGLQTRSPEFQLTTGPRTEWFLVDEFRPEGVPLKTGWRLATTSTITSYPTETYYVRADALGAQPLGKDLRNHRLEFWTKPMYFREENVGFAMLSGRAGSSTWLLGYLQDPEDLNFKFGLWELPSGQATWRLDTCFFDGENWLMNYYDIPDENGWVIDFWTTRAATGGSDSTNGLRSSPLATTRVYPTPLGEN